MVGGYSFEDSKFNRATQALRQVGSSFKVYVYADALEKGATPFDTIVDLPFTTISGGQPYTPHNYDEKFEGTITLRRALAGSRNVPAGKLAEKEGINTVVDMARRFGITTSLPPYLPFALGAADMKLEEHVSAFPVFPNVGMRETGARAALPIWLEFMQGALAGTPVTDFPNVVPLEQLAGEHQLNLTTPDTAPTEDEPAPPKEKPPAIAPVVNSTTNSTRQNPSN